MAKIEQFGFKRGDIIVEKYEVMELLGSGWESEVYRIREKSTDIDRAAKFFFPHRNVRNKVAKAYAKKLYRIRHNSAFIQYHSSERIEHRGHDVTCLISEFVEGEILSKFVDRQPGKRLHYFMALHILQAITEGLEGVHALGEYHGDLHWGNILINQIGTGFQIKMIDPFDWKDSKRLNIQKDIFDLIRIFYDCMGGKKWYSKLPLDIRHICYGLKQSLIAKHFQDATELRFYLESMDWCHRK